MRKDYTAKLTCTKRDVHTNSIKVMLKDIYDEEGTLFRDHCFVSLSKKLEKLLPKTTRHTRHIKFTAKVYDYRGINGDTKYSLKSLKFK